MPEKPKGLTAEQIADAAEKTIETAANSVPNNSTPEQRKEATQKITYTLTDLGVL